MVQILSTSHASNQNPRARRHAQDQVQVLASRALQRGKLKSGNGTNGCRRRPSVPRPGLAGLVDGGDPGIDGGDLDGSLSVTYSFANAIMIVPPLGVLVVTGADLLQHSRSEGVFKSHFPRPLLILSCEFAFLCSTFASPSCSAGVPNADVHAGRNFL